MADIFDEISDDLRAERMQNLLRRYGTALVLAAVLIVAAVAGWQFWRTRQAQQTDQVAAAYLGAARQAQGPATADAAAPARLDAAAAFDAIARTAPEGYATLARLRASAIRAAAGDAPAALQLWDQVAADAGADLLLRDLARLNAVQHQPDTADPQSVEARLTPLLAPGNAFRPLALEQQALLALRMAQPDRARDILTSLQTDPAAPDGVRNRAAALLGRIGAPGVSQPTPGAGG